MKEYKEKTYGTMYSLVLSTVFLILLFAFNFHLNATSLVSDLKDFDLFEISILSLTIFRVIRLLVYDSVSQFIRDIFLDVSEVNLDGKAMIHRQKPKDGIKRLMCDLLSCPWCTSVWVSLFAAYVYLLFPNLWFVYLVFAVSGISSFIQLSINRIGWQAEYKKTMTEDLQDQLAHEAESKSSSEHSKISCNC